MKTGYSLIELMVVISISSIIIVSLVRLMATAIPVYRSTVAQTMSNETARVQLKRISDEIRNSRPSDTGAFPIVEASPNRIVFYANIDSDAATERVRYELTGTDLVRGVVKPTGSPLAYDVATEAVVTVARSIRNGSTSLFTYYGKDYPADSRPIIPAP